MPFGQLKRREFITLVGGAAAWPMAARAQQPAMPVIGFLHPESDTFPDRLRNFRQGLKETGYVEGENVAIEYRWAESRIDRLPEMVTDLIRRQVTVLTAMSGVAAVAAKAANTTIPIVFVAGEDPVRLGLVASLARPGGNATGINFFNSELTAKRLGFLRDLVPTAKRVGVLVDPNNAAGTESTLRDAESAARTMGLQILVVNATTSHEIDAAFATFVRERVDALFVGPSGFFAGRRVHIASQAMRRGIPAAYYAREAVEVGGLMSYGAARADMYRQVGVYTGQILKGAKPADLPVLQSSKFEFVINAQTARLLDIEVPNALQLLADEVIE